MLEMKHGKYTAEFAEELSKDLEDYSDFQVYYDHGDSLNPNVGKITPYFRDKPYDTSTTLSNVDILITHKANNIENPILLIEIEETYKSPKQILGDIFNLFFAGSVRFRLDKRSYKVFPLDQANLIVGVAVGSKKASQKIDNIYDAIAELKELISGSKFDESIGNIELLKNRDLFELLSQVKKNVLQIISQYAL